MKGGAVMAQGDMSMARGPQRQIHRDTREPMQPPTDVDAVDPVECRSLWQAVLVNEMRVACGENVSTSGGGLCGISLQRGALDWFFTPDAAVVAMFAGVDIGLVRERIGAMRDHVAAVCAARDPADRTRIRMRMFRT